MNKAIVRDLMKEDVNGRELRRRGTRRRGKNHPLVCNTRLSMKSAFRVAMKEEVASALVNVMQFCQMEKEVLGGYRSLRRLEILARRLERFHAFEELWRQKAARRKELNNAF